MEYNLAEFKNYSFECQLVINDCFIAYTTLDIYRYSPTYLLNNQNKQTHYTIETTFKAKSLADIRTIEKTIENVLNRAGNDMLKIKIYLSSDLITIDSFTHYHYTTGKFLFYNCLTKNFNR
jgi:hypothetical protein